jgi:hypothetical protein
MAVNQKLTHAVKDRVVQNFQLNASEVLISFVDGWTMKVKIVESNSPPLREGARIRQISEDQAKLLFECEDDSTLDVTVVDPGNSVSVRDKNNQVEYLGWRRLILSDYFFRLLIIPQAEKARCSHFAIQSPFLERNLANKLRLYHWTGAEAWQPEYQTLLIDFIRFDLYLSYSADGRMYAIGVVDDRPKARDLIPTDEEKVKLQESMFAYAGMYTARQWEGSPSRRYFLESILDRNGPSPVL